MPYARVVPVYEPTVRTLCLKPYPGHPRGCPNFGRRDTCPPQARHLPELLDLQQPVWAIWTVFPYALHCATMRLRHPDWSARRVACCLYWQQTARAQLAQEIARFSQTEGGVFRILPCPEATGVHVSATLAPLGVCLEWPPRVVTHHVALAGVALP